MKSRYIKLKYFLLILLSAIALSVSSQDRRIEYTYDAAGNRVTRTIILSSSQLRSAASAAGNEETDEETLAQEKVYSDVLNRANILIYPNPTKGLLRIEISGNAESKPVNLQVYDMNGKILLQESNVVSSVTLNLSSQPAGIYMLRLTSDTEKKEWKIIKE